MAASLESRFSPLPDLTDLASRWQALEARADNSFFLGWTWMGCWLAATGVRPELLSVTADGQDVALATMGYGMRPNRLGPVATLWLNESGVPAADRPFIEYNGLLAARDAPDGVTACAMAVIQARRDWRALRIAGIVPDHPLLTTGRFHRRVRHDVSPAFAIDLDAVRAAKGDYLSLLSSNTRSQIKRSAKDYGEAPPVITLPSDATQADGWLEEMRLLNTGRHSDNAWEEPVFRAFARALVVRGLENGEVELLRITQGPHLLGLLLNFSYRGRAMNYQSAFAAPLTAKSKPGLMCHAAAVTRYADAGDTLYSLLAGKDRYKESLSTTSETLEWWSLERFSPRLEIEHQLRRLLSRPASG